MTDLLQHLQREAGLMVAAVRAADLGAPVPSCPGWALRDLVLHTGTIHRWSLGRAVGAEREPPRELTDADLADWLAEGAARLHAGLAAADPDAPCRGFEEPVTVAFWIRRQAHETAVHRVDAQLVTGTAHPVPADLALDGVREVFEVFAPRQVALGRSEPAAYGLVLVTPDGTVTVPGPEPVTVRGSASDVLLALWRRPADVTASDPAAWRALLDGGLTP